MVLSRYAVSIAHDHFCIGYIAHSSVTGDHMRSPRQDGEWN
jgi:hypothetical protein